MVRRPGSVNNDLVALPYDDERPISCLRSGPRRCGRVVRAATPAISTTTFSVILSLSFSHLLNDMIQSLMRRSTRSSRSSYWLSFTQIGLITLAFQ